MLSLVTPVEQLTRVGAATASRLQRLEIYTVRDLLFHFPHRYEDFSSLKPIAQLQEGEQATVRGKVVVVSQRQALRRNLSIATVQVADDSGSLDVIFFNQGFLVKSLQEGTEVSLSGKIERRGKKLLLKNPKLEKTDGEQRSVYTGRLLPVYPLSLNLTQKQMQFLLHHVLEARQQVVDPLPTSLRQAEGLPSLPETLRLLHAPEKMEDVVLAQRRLAFEEIFYLQLQMNALQKMNQQLPAPAMTFFEDKVREFVGSLPFELTVDQKKTAWKIFLDMQAATAMNRLVQGDVGCGKTVIAGLAMYLASLNGFQSALMSPTEVLASQHFATFVGLFAACDVPVALYTRTQQLYARQGVVETWDKKKMRAALADGEVSIVIGTHALIQGDVAFRRLGLSVVDEQHRFGVEQRKALRERSGQDGLMPHLLSMTATPIPRTLTLALYGDLAISSIRQKPKNRLPIETKLVYQKDRASMDEFLHEQLAAGAQCYVVCPLIEDSDTLGVKSVTQEGERLKAALPGTAIAVLHGKMMASEKERLMQSFKAGKTQILVATTVIEVGVDVPNATIMLIEGAERFGLSQLHQIRGRVGRSDQQSYCFLLPSLYTQASHERLKQFLACRDGFDVAELDLRVRGAGEMLGTRQSGLAALAYVNLADTPFIEQVQGAAKAFLETDGFKNAPGLEEHIRKLNDRIHLE
ncbi:MAG: ATP-dependent DNA helicase RecG [Parcubacteria group bacterium]|nr:ATP-dependent DNA helicase RecG [Parcubacteria group bacterium]